MSRATPEEVQFDVVNVGSKGKDITVGKVYRAIVDGNLDFRVRDNSGRWSKYAPNNFALLTDVHGVLDATPYGDTIKRMMMKTLASSSSVPTSMPTVEIDLEKLTVDFEDVSKRVVAINASAPKTLVQNATIQEKSLADLMAEASKLVSGVSAQVGELEKLVEGKKEIMADAVKTTPTPTEKPKRTLRDILVPQGVPDELINRMNEWRQDMAKSIDLPDNIKARIPKPTELFEGGELWTTCIIAILANQHILLSGEKATGKNTLAKSLAFAFGRPIWDVSFHSNISKDEIIGCDTFKGGEVVFNPGMAHMCATYGGFGVLDEINMAKDSAIAVLNSMLDDRRVIDVPGYDAITLHQATTFIGTMNYGYVGTRPLNEALASRFVIPDIKELGEDGIIKLLIKKFPTCNASVLKFFAGTFQDLQKKAKNGEISTASVDLRGIIAALKMIQLGMKPNTAMVDNVANKAFDEFERTIVKDVINTRIPDSWKPLDVFSAVGSRTIAVDMSGVK